MGTDLGHAADRVPEVPRRSPLRGDRDRPGERRLFVEGGEPAEIATWYQDELEMAAFSTEALSGPLEDGGYVIDSTGQDPRCRLSVTIAPLGGTTTLTVLYGAACPHD